LGWNDDHLREAIVVIGETRLIIHFEWIPEDVSRGKLQTINKTYKKCSHSPIGKRKIGNQEQ
jgi:hypothetical protein